MKLIRPTVAAAALFLFPAILFAGVAGSDHDLTGTGDKLCFACHIPHNALGDKLWARTPSGTFTGVQDLCYTCHDGGVTSVGVTTAFDTQDEQHIAVGTDCSGDGACHDVHNQNPNGTGRFTVAGITHFTDGTFTCNQCHSVHGAKPQTTSPPGLTNPILLHNNMPEAYYGNFCIHCHLGVPPGPAVPGTGGQASHDPYAYTEFTNDGTETKHPSVSTTGSTPVIGCNKCHDVHDPNGTDYGYLLIADNANSAFCVSCHTQAGAPAIGGNTHFTGVPGDVNMNSGLTPALPWANQIDEDGNPGADWPTATANTMVCETCHSVHRQGAETNGGYLLRDENVNNEICQACHSDN